MLDRSLIGRHLFLALSLRIERAEQSPVKDAGKAEQVEVAASRFQHLPELGNKPDGCRENIRQYRQMLAELRVSVFAPELGTALPVSAKRLEKKWLEIEQTCHSIE